MSISQLYSELPKCTSKALTRQMPNIPLYPVFDAKGRSTTEYHSQLEATQLSQNRSEFMTSSYDATTASMTETTLTNESGESFSEGLWEKKPYRMIAGNTRIGKDGIELSELVRSRGADPSTVAAHISLQMASEEYPYTRGNNEAPLDGYMRTFQRGNGSYADAQLNRQPVVSTSHPMQMPTLSSKSQAFPPPPKRKTMTQIDTASSSSREILKIKAQYVFMARMGEELNKKECKWQGNYAYKSVTIAEFYQFYQTTPNNSPASSTSNVAGGAFASKSLGDMAYDIETVYTRMENDKLLSETLDKEFSDAINRATSQEAAPTSQLLAKNKKTNSKFFKFGSKSKKPVATCPAQSTFEQNRLLYFYKDKFSRIHIFNKSGSGRFYLLSNGDFVALNKVVINKQEESIRAGICAAIEEVGLDLVLKIAYDSLNPTERRVFGGLVAMARVYGEHALNTAAGDDEQRIAQIYRNEVKRYGIIHVLQGTQPCKTSTQAKLAILGDTKSTK